MRTEGNDAAFARPFSCDPKAGYVLEQAGLTKREEFAKAILQGIWAYPGDLRLDGGTIEEMAVESADRLIAALNKRRDNAIDSILNEVKS